MKVLENFFFLLDGFPVCYGYPGAVLTYMDPVSFSRKLLVRPSPAADPAVVAASFLHESIGILAESYGKSTSDAAVIDPSILKGCWATSVFANERFSGMEKIRNTLFLEAEK